MTTLDSLTKGFFGLCTCIESLLQLVFCSAWKDGQVTGRTVELAYVDQGYTGPAATAAAQQHGIRIEVVKDPMAKRGFVLLPRRWVVERSFAWAARFRRLTLDDERLPQTLKGIHFIAFAILMASRLIKLATS